MQGYAGDSTGAVTASANTAIQFLIQPSGPATVGTVTAGNEAVVSGQAGITRPTTISYTNLQTLQTVTLCRPIGKTTAAAVAASGQRVLTLTADPGLAASNNLAANDFIAVREIDGVTRLYKVTNITGGGASMNTSVNLMAGVKAGASVWDFGIPTDTDPRTGAAHAGPLQALNTTTTTQDRECGIMPSHEADSPILINSDNLGPGAGTLAFASWFYSRYVWAFLCLGMALSAGA